MRLNNEKKICPEQEFEVSMIVDASAAESVFREIAALKTIEKYRFIQKKTLPIHDCYFDLENRLLLAYGFGLRLRNINEKQLITLKGKSEKTAWCGIKRLE